MGLLKSLGKLAGTAIGASIGGPAGASIGGKIGGMAGGVAEGKKKKGSSLPAIAEQLNAFEGSKPKELSPTKVAKTYDQMRKNPWDLPRNWYEDLGGEGHLDFERYT